MVADVGASYLDVTGVVVHGEVEIDGRCVQSMETRIRASKCGGRALACCGGRRQDNEVWSGSRQTQSTIVRVCGFRSTMGESYPMWMA